MARFHDSTIHSAVATSAAPASDFSADAHTDLSIGDIIRQTGNLTAEDVEKVLRYQREKGVRFGEAAIALGLASTDDVIRALSQQFSYPNFSSTGKSASAELVTLNQPFSYQSEAFRAIRSQVMMKVFSAKEVTRSAVAVVSPGIGDGKTFFAANLAASLAQLGGRTLIVDGALRRPRLHEVFGVSNTAGLSGILSGRGESQVIQQVPDVSSLFLLPAGSTPPNPLELIERPAFGLLLRELISKFDHVIVDTPAAIISADAFVTAAKCGAVLLLGRKNHSRLSALQDLVLSFSESPARLLGVVMNEH